MVKMIEGKKTVPMMNCFISLTSSPILLQIACIRVCQNAKMTLYNTYYVHIFRYFTWFVTTQSFQNHQTLGQFFDPLYPWTTRRPKSLASSHLLLKIHGPSRIKLQHPWQRTLGHHPHPWNLLTLSWRTFYSIWSLDRL